MIKKEIQKEIEKILENKIEVPFFREGNFVKFKMPAGMERPQVFINGIPFRYKSLNGMCYIEVEEGLLPKKVEVSENIEIWRILEEFSPEGSPEEILKKEKIEDTVPSCVLEDKYQVEAVKTAYQNNFSLIFGPPGSGKTTVISEILKTIQDEGRIAIVSLSNLAVDNVLDRLPEEFREFTVRVGNPSLDTAKEMSLSKQVKEERKELRKKYLKTLAYEIASSKLDYFVDLIKEKEIEIKTIEEEIKSLTSSETDYKVKEEEEKLRRYEVQKQLLEKELNSLSFINFKKKKKLQAEIEKKEIEIENQKKYLTLLVEKSNLEKERFKETKEEMYKILIDRKVAVNNELSKVKAKYEKYKAKAEKYKTDDTAEILKEKMDNLREIERSLVYKAKIIGTTLHTFFFRFRRFYFDTIIVDEVSQVPYPFITVLRNFCKRLVLLGDPHQLSPVTKSGIPSIFGFIKPDVVLRNVRRYPSEIGRIVNTLSGEKLNCVKTGGSVEWIDVKGQVKREKGKIYNPSHIKEIKKLVEKDKDKDIAVVTPYRYQAYLLRKKGIESGTIHSFQGQERDEIIIDLTDADSKFINKNMLIVALSRAKEKVVIIGDLEKALNSKNKVVREFATLYKKEFIDKKPKLKVVS